MPSPFVVIVTGANRGIGHAIAKQILARHDLSSLKLFATSRRGDNLGLESTLAQHEVLYRPLDIVNLDSVTAFEDEIKHYGPISVLINNAGINLDADYNLETAKRTIDVNYRGTVEMCQRLLPHLTNAGRIVNMASVASSLKPYSSSIQERFRSAQTFPELDQLAAEYEHSVASASEESAGFFVPPRSYSISKALLRAATRILSNQHHHQHPQSNVCINCCCPGWIKTDMGRLVGRGNAPKTAEEGAKIPVRLALDDIAGVTGQYFANDSVRSREMGKVQEW